MGPHHELCSIAGGAAGGDPDLGPGKRVTGAKRRVARALLFDGRDRLLLIRWRDPVTGTEFWEPPGGAARAGESLEAALRREVAEETGVADIDVGDCVREFDRRFVWAGREFDCVERYFSCRLAGEARVAPRRDEVEQQGFIETRWWPRAQLKATMEQLQPPELPEMLEYEPARPDGSGAAPDAAGARPSAQQTDARTPTGLGTSYMW